jgi:hypothetical protein
MLKRKRCVWCHARRQRLRVAALALAASCHSGAHTSRPKRRRRLRQERVGSTLRKREGRCLSQPRTRHRAVLVQQPNSGGHITPTIFPRSLCWLCKRPAISVTRLQAASDQRGPAGGLRRPSAPGGDHVQGAPALVGDGAAWLWPVFSRIVACETWCAPSLREGLVRWQPAQAYVTHTSARL